MNENSSYDVVIIGGGLAGLSCALELYDRGKDSFVLLEANNRFGGRTCSDKTSHGARVDTGGAYLGPDQDRVLQLVERFELTLYPVPHKGNTVIVDRDGSRSVVVNKSPQWGLHSRLDLNTLLLSLQEIADSVDVEFPWKTPNARKLDAMSVSQWVDSQRWTQAASDVVKASVHSLTCSQPHEISLLWFAWLMKSCANLKALMAVENGGQAMKLKEGTAEISARIAKLLGPTRARMNHPVREIDYTDASRIVVTAEVDGARVQFCCRQLVVAMAPSLYRTVVWKPALPPQKSQLSERMPMGSIIKTNMYYKSQHWVDRGLSGECISATGSPVVYCVDDTKPDGSFPSIMGFVSGDACRELQRLTREERCAVLQKYYQHALQMSEPPIAYVEKNWCEEVWAGGCYMGTLAPGVITSFFPAIREPVANRRIHFAGTETAIRWSGYMDGAVESGQRCAAAVLSQEWDWRVRPPTSRLLPGPNVDFDMLERNAPSISVLFRSAAALALFSVVTVYVRSAL